jgi:hypothetical protein
MRGLIVSLILSLLLAACGRAAPAITPSATGGLTADPEQEQAYRTLIAFFDRLHAGDYEQAAELYGGSYETLMYWNPMIPPDDHLALWKNGCEINGLVCLKVQDAILEEGAAPGEFRFILEFENEDGTRFTLGPCCGASETEMPPKWQFPYTVKRVGDQFQVMDLPVYMP